ncbi:thiamine ABC transporter substrate-binding protein [Halapricum sp. CBA1109]|uniref:thiamine ABC transporter substrate-binding protein n=1 Tax=Halapricum sp. CBA1109 TaxID=2668068 RepID=UPI0012FABF3F|nr:thiamine ABC transporter substrate-binding protein [Halapricum sp. CBA1109]MUV89976.1 thiamine ABC transporter substrate-binding protein [Halapricum sp. CBA1109]
MRRRRYLKTAGAGTVIALAGCAASPVEENATTPNGRATIDGTPSGTLTVATYDSFTGEETAGNYLKSAFEEEYPEVTVEFTVPSNGVNQYIQRKQSGASIDADLYVGLNTGELVRADEQLEDSLFLHSRDYLDRGDALDTDLEIDPQGRAIPYDTGYISLVYDESAVDAPETFDDLLEPAYADSLITQDAQQSDPGRAFVLWTVDAKGEDGYLDYWADLLDNGVQVLDDWSPAYEAYSNEEAPMVVSYSTDQVFYGADADLTRHQIGFLNDQGYANPETMARFADTDNRALARLFMDFVLQPDHQGQVAERNVQFPAVTDAQLDETFDSLAKRPPETVTFSYDRLQGNVDGWISDWARQVASE